MREAFPEQLLEAGDPESYGGVAAPGLKQTLVVLPGYEWLVTEEWVGRLKSLEEAQGLTPPGGLAPIARPLPRTT
jgi:hypothetical protein